MGLHSEPWIGSVLGSDPMIECSTVVNGLRFYTPDECDGLAATAYERAEALGGPIQVSVVDDEPDGVYVFTPGGEHLLADLDLKPLLKLEADMKHLRAKRSNRRPAPLPTDNFTPWFSPD